MEEFWKAIDTPAKHPSEKGLRMLSELTSQNPSINEEQRHDLKEHSKAAPNYEGTSSSLKLKVEFLEIPLSDISKATNDFKDKPIGSGGYANVYKAKLNVLDIESLSTMEVKCKEELPKIVKPVAIKRINKREDNQDEQGFETEIKLLTSCKHPNVVSLLGYCRENNELILVYEFVSNGSLGDYLKNDDKKVNLTWAQRLRISLDAANGINYLHTEMEGKQRIIHRDIKSDNILLDENLNAKVADFGLSRFHPTKQQLQETMRATSIVGTDVYMDPEYSYEYKYKKEIDTYSFGIVLFEILSGRLAYDPVYVNENRIGIAHVARRHAKDKKLKQLIDPKLIEEVRNEIFTLNRDLNQDPFEAFFKLACECSAVAQADRPTMEVVIKELQNALNLQEFKSATSNFSIISSATNNFSDENIITKGALGKLYKGQLLWNGNFIHLTVRRLECVHGQGDEFQTEISTLKRLNHRNIASVLGHYDEKFIIYEQAFHGTLDQHLSDPNLTLSQRLKICLGVARALGYIQHDLIHCDINTSKILLDKDWEPKMYGFELSTKYPQSWRHRLLYFRYFNTNTVMTRRYDVYSFGVLLLEVLCGKKPMNSNDGIKEELDDIIDSHLSKQMDTGSLHRVKDLADKCFNLQNDELHPSMDRIIKELEKVWLLQSEHENCFGVKVCSKAAYEDEGRSSNILNEEVLKIPLGEIRHATNDFDKSYLVGDGGFADIYRAKLDVLDIHSLSSMERKCNKERPKIRKDVSLKRLKSRLSSEQMFIAEIEMINSCKHFI